jgi:hypothetical protein
MYDKQNMLPKVAVAQISLMIRNLSAQKHDDEIVGKSTKKVERKMPLL